MRVCDLTQNLAGPLCAQILGDLGADVIKVEAPGGDPGRAWGPPFWGTDSTLFLSANRNKRSIVLDLKSPEGRGILHRIAKESDVLVQSARFGVPERLEYDYETIRALREDIIYMAISAYGDRGPMRELPGYDPLMQAFSGIMSVTGNPGAPPSRVGGSVVDFGTGMWSTIAILSALRPRDATGEGAKLDAALLDTAVGWVSYHMMGYLATGDVPGPMGSGMDSIVPYQGFQTADGSVMISGGSDRIFVRLCEALGLGELGADPRMPTSESSTPLMVAAGVGTSSPGEDPGTESEVLSAVQLALELGGDLNGVDDNGETVMHGAAYKHVPSVVQFLADQGAESDIWHQENLKGWTPLKITEGVKRGMNIISSGRTEVAVRDVMSRAGLLPVGQFQ